MASEAVDITPKSDGGVLKKILKEGVGIAKPSNGTTVKVHYTGTLENGDKFDSSLDRSTPFDFLLGRSQVIKGWDVGVATMTKGEKAVFTIRSDYGYGDAGSPPKIPGGATLIFEVELLDWEAEDLSPDRDSSILRTIIVEGSKSLIPNDTSTVTAHVVGSHEGREFYNKEVVFAIGEASEAGLPEGIDRALRRFCKGEKSKIELKGTRFTYGTTAPEEYGLPPNAPLEFTIFLKDFEKVPSTWEMSTEEKMTSAKAAKERGTEFLQQGKLRLAWNKYKRVEDILEYEKNLDEEEKKNRDALLLSAYLNLSLTASKLNEQLDCIKYCDKALEVDAKSVKALYRKATAILTMTEFADAQKIYEKIVEIEPDNKAAAQQILVCKNKIREENEKDRKRFKSMFAKISEAPPEPQASHHATKIEEDGQVPTTSGNTTTVA
ncbi:unnamed protein product [Caenorhabditis auriculariae]|uniref:peptidylprolyl isomerase n=1 Tax=Caenorhabditis auriculariae TaxID=2777116 RepID=A0A8S1H4E9_9PELO|nr:unnamed protein product [Caenorhabditis auriculariae]